MKMAPLLVLVCACASTSAVPEQKPAGQGPPAAAEVTAFLDKTNTELRTYGIKSSTAQWIQNTYITDDTDRAAADASAQSLKVQTEAVKQAAKYKDVQGLDADHARMLENLRTRGAGPSDPAHRLERTTLNSTHS